MRRYNIKWLIFICFLVVLSVLATWLLQNWQRSHFDCTGDLLVQYPDRNSNISIRYSFDGSRGVALLRGEITTTDGRTEAVNQNVWFTFTRKGNDYFLHSQTAVSSTGEKTVSPLLLDTLPDFYLRANTPFYLSIVRLNSDTWQFYTSRSPSIFCRR